MDPSTLLFCNRWEEILLQKCIKQPVRSEVKEIVVETATVVSNKEQRDEGAKKMNGAKADSAPNLAKMGNGVSKSGNKSPSPEKTLSCGHTSPSKVSSEVPTLLENRENLELSGKLKPIRENSTI